MIESKTSLLEAKILHVSTHLKMSSTVENKGMYKSTHRPLLVRPQNDRNLTPNKGMIVCFWKLHTTWT